MRRPASVNKFQQLAAATGGLKFDMVSNADAVASILKKMAPRFSTTTWPASTRPVPDGPSGTM